MFSKSNLLATLAASVVMFLLGYLIWGIATVDFYESHTLNNIAKDPMNIPLIFLGNLIAAFAMSTLYGKWARGAHSIKEGFEFGALIGLLIGFGIYLVMYATTDMLDLTGHIVEGIIDVVYYGIGGVVIAIVYKATAPKSS
ncbi:cation transport ATPase [Saonia flava]|uniref:Cation transport ATPase n=1 Tax=Saonia flava TaxID=523696 RepID=A0A846R4V4_9FLAO|nr:hypothetical protein [Saonia flava]NJB71829.1 cation transport ATPase [Saonia flava]